MTGAADFPAHSARPTGESSDVIVARLDERTWAIFEALGRTERTQAAQRAEDRAEHARQRAEDRAALQELVASLAGIDTRLGNRLDDLESKVTKRLDEHEDRIEAIELRSEWSRGKAAGVVAAAASASGLAAFAVNVLALHR